MTLLHAGEPGAAIGHLRFYLGRHPSADDADAVGGFLKQARGEVAKWN